MVEQLPIQNQKEIFQLMLVEFIDMNHELILLAHKIDTYEGIEKIYEWYGKG